jgi:hypothetical protein
MKTYVLTLSQVFPKWHQKAGQATFFKDKFHAAITNNDEYWNKLHTIRANYELWRKRFEQIESGEACLSVRQWTGRPYASKQVEIARLTKEDGIGLQALEFLEFDPAFKPGIWIAGDTYSQDHKLILAKNDGLTFDDWNAWFFGKKKNGKPLYDLSQTMAIIHFTSFRYGKE